MTDISDDKPVVQQRYIEKVIIWLKEEGYTPAERTHLRQDSSYFAVVMGSKRKGFHVKFPLKNLDSIIITEVIALDADYQKAYKTLPAVEQNRVFFDLKIALLQMNVNFQLQKDVRDIQLLEIEKPIYFDGLTKDRFFDTIFRVGHAVEIARVKLGQFRDSILPSQAGELGDGDNLSFLIRL